MTRMFSSACRLSAGFAARAVAIAILIAALAGIASAQQLSVNPTSLLFAAAAGSTTAQTQSVSVLASPSNIFWYAQLPGDRPAWLTNITANGTTSTTPLNVTVNPTGLAAGDYSTTVQVYSPYSTNAPTSQTPLSITVNLVVGGTGTIAADKSALTYTATAGGSNPATQNVRVTTTSTSNVVATTSISYTSGSGWLSVSPTSGTLNSSTALDLTVSAATGSLATNAYAARLTITSGSSTKFVDVTFNVQAGSIISANPNPVYLTAVQNSTTPVTQVVTVTNSSSSSVTVTPSVSSGSGWLSTNPASPSSVTIPGLSTGNVTFSAVASGLSLGTTAGQVTLTPSTGNAVQVPVNFTVSATSTLQLSKTTMLFSTSGSQVDTVNLTNSSGSGIPFDITVTYQSSTGWLQISPVSGTVAAGSYQTVNVTANAAGLGTGNYTATINVTGGGQTQTINVTLSAGGAVSISASPASLTINSGVGSQASGTVTISSTSSATVSLTNGTSITCTFSSFCASANVSSMYVAPGSPASFYITSSSGLAYGTYYATLNFSSSAGSLTVPLTINVGTGGGGGSITASPSSLSFSAAAGGAVQTSQVYLSASTYGTYTASSNQSWLNVGYQGSMSASVYAPGYTTVYANPAGLSAGTYSGAITIYGGTGGNLTIYATFVVGGGTGTGLTVSPSTLALSAAVGGQSTVQTVSVYANTQTYYYATVQSGSSWLILNQSSGNTPGSITMYANAAGLTAGTYYGYVSVTSSSLGTQTVTVTLTVGGGAGNVSASPSALSFVTPVGGTPSQQSIVITSAGGAFTATAVATTGGNWLSVSPTSGSSGATVYVSVNTTGLATAVYTGQINITSVYGNLTVPVTLNVGGTQGAIMANPAALQFTAAAGGQIPAAQSVSLTTSNSSADYTISGVPAWMSVTPPAGTITPTSSGTLTVYVNPGTLGVGTYNGSIVIAGGGGSAIVQVTFTVGGGGGGGAGGGLTASPGSLTMSAPLGSTSPVQQYVSLSGYLPYNAYATTSTGAGWLTVTPASGTAPATLYVQANPAAVSTGTYTGSITVYTSQGSLSIPVTFNVGTSGGAAIQVSPSALSFSGQTGGSAPAAQYVSVSSSTGYSTYFNATPTVTSGGGWLSVTPSNGVTPVTLTASVNPSGLAAGTYYGTIAILGSDGYSQQSVQVTLTLTSTNLTVTPASLAFTAATGGAAAAQTLSVSSALGSIAFSAAASVTSGSGWLAVSPNSGNTSSTLSVTVNLSGLSPGSYTGNITVNSGVGTLNVPVTLTVTQQVNLAVTPDALAFEALTGATSIPAKTVNVSVSTGSLQFTATAATSSGGSSWLQVTPASSMTPGTLTVTASATGLNPGVFNGTVTVSSAGASNSPRVIQVTLTVTSPVPVVTAVLNAAAGRGGILAAGTIASIYGTALAAESAVFPQIVSGGLVPTQVGDVRVLFDGIAAPILYTQAKQVNTVIPWSLFGRTTVSVVVEYKGNRSAAVQIQLYDAAPGIFSIDGSGTGQGAILNQDGGVNSANNGAAADSIASVFATGMGQTEPQGVDGAFPTQVLPKPMLPVTVLLGNSEAEVTYGGAAPYLVSGAMQVNVRIPRGLQPGAYAVTLRIGRFSSQLGVTMVVK
jgi:uncharacterized protein (TIGR03437 family)